MHPDEPEDDVTLEELFTAAQVVYDKNVDRMVDFYGVKITFSNLLIQIWAGTGQLYLECTINLGHRTLLQKQGRFKTRKDLLGLMKLL